MGRPHGHTGDQKYAAAGESQLQKGSKYSMSARPHSATNIECVLDGLYLNRSGCRSSTRQPGGTHSFGAFSVTLRMGRDACRRAHHSASSGRQVAQSCLQRRRQSANRGHLGGPNSGHATVRLPIRHHRSVLCSVSQFGFKSSIPYAPAFCQIAS
jgi:hypothetical protein